MNWTNNAVEWIAVRSGDTSFNNTARCLACLAGPIGDYRNTWSLYYKTGIGAEHIQSGLDVGYRCFYCKSVFGYGPSRSMHKTFVPYMFIDEI